MTINVRLGSDVVNRLAIALVTLILFPPVISAQSAIGGLVKDASGGVLPGVTVEASSPALIEKTRTVDTDDQGRYMIVDLRPGTYKVTFTLTGFTGLARDDIELPSNFTATVNAELKVGSVEETVTVSGQAPVVDVQNSQRTAVLPRELLDSVPTSRNYAPVVAMAIGVKVSGQNVGGARTSVQQRLSVHGSVSKDTTIMVDGMKMNTLSNDGDSQAQHNDAMTQEVVVQTSALSPEVSGGGVYVNLIPREGGNTISGASYIGHSRGAWQSTNLTPELRAKGVAAGDKLDSALDVNPSVGGPLRRNALWFFGSGRIQNNNNIVANSFYPDGRPGIQDQRVRNGTVRLTWQANARNKVTAYLDRASQNIGHIFTSGTDVATASSPRTSPLYYTAEVKWTSPLSSKLLFEAGWGGNALIYSGIYLPGVLKERGTPEWYATASRQDIITGTRTTSPANWQYHYPYRYTLQTSASYVTGSHSFKAGVQDSWGKHNDLRNANADLVQRYRNGAPDSVIVYNTPTEFDNRVKADLGIYVRDTWTIKRLTLQPGVRLEYYNSFMEAVDLPAGRFVPRREFARVPNMPSWFNVSPRFGLAYDLAGDAKTAIKAGVSKYLRQYGTGFADLYSPGNLQSDTRDWRDLNGDDIAQDNEIGPSNNSRFGAAPARNPDPNIKREYDIEYSLGIDRQLLAGLAVSGAWVRRETYNRGQQINLLTSVSDYASFQTPSPLNGELITIYNLNPAKQGLVDILDVTATDRSKNRQSYTGFEVSTTMRLRGGLILAGWSADRPVTVACDGYDPNTFRYCDQSQLDIPFTKDFKLSGSYPLPLGLQVGTTFQSYKVAGVSGSTSGSGKWLAVNWAAPASVFPRGQRTQAVTVNLIPPGSKYPERWNQLDLSAKRIFKAGRIQYDANVEIFNVLNGNTVLSENQTFGSSLGLPLEILQPRLLRLSTQIKF